VAFDAVGRVLLAVAAEAASVSVWHPSLYFAIESLAGHLDLYILYRHAGRSQEGQEHLHTPTTMYRDMDIRYWMERAEAELS